MHVACVFPTVAQHLKKKSQRAAFKLNQPCFRNSAQNQQGCIAETEKLCAGSYTKQLM